MSNQYTVADLVCEHALVKGWELVFDTGTTKDTREIVWERPEPDVNGYHHQMEIHFQPSGRVSHYERRRNGEWYIKGWPMEGFGTTECQLEALRMMGQ
ncbi:hypothetical protein J4U02_gp128 [Mycobacterium phage Aziz]|uniref:Uncharacterized protein n=3 Tax=Reyvirus TaxID=1623301 RepID=A0A7G9A2J6_9CAUD|nr:hypothetical protein J4U02_gp128 [Mycobacterium phage Aziz]YP_010013881.1 hypothetical protein J4U03_gp128 [Mycobacterium phage Estes]YP_010014034.1 hypothetical protein J4U04_gp131 [Mycobacterium phage MrMagoo]ARM70300.1 hypothetical protein SEA_GARDENSALSA_147 [Mycobacterium phage GardenSalsa]ASR75971.1 hypothetical protein SEA_GENEVAB15_149 [Mycobacterium phage GenevaB15]APQ42231.1 hypothetical protein PBI_MRMAGOO_149 [Mycobacterium phage MrMagoo]QNJ56784.1 hypothetical protein SEA_AZIZ